MSSSSFGSVWLILEVGAARPLCSSLSTMTLDMFVCVWGKAGEAPLSRLFFEVFYWFLYRAYCVGVGLVFFKPD